MKLKRWWGIILMAGLAVALSAPSALAWTSRPGFGHNPGFRGAAPHGAAYGYRGQRPAWNHGNARGWQHHNQWQHRNQWNHRNAYRAHYQGGWGHRPQAGQFQPPYQNRPNGSYTRPSNVAYQTGPRR